MSQILNNPNEVVAAGGLILSGSTSGTHSTGDYTSRQNAFQGVIDGRTFGLMQEMNSLAARGGNDAFNVMQNINRFLGIASQTVSAFDESAQIPQ